MPFLAAEVTETTSSFPVFISVIALQCHSNSKGTFISFTVVSYKLFAVVLMPPRQTPAAITSSGHRTHTRYGMGSESDACTEQERRHSGEGGSKELCTHTHTAVAEVIYTRKPQRTPQHLLNSEADQTQAHKEKGQGTQLPSAELENSSPSSTRG